MPLNVSDTQTKLDGVLQVLQVLATSFLPTNAAAIAALLRAGAQLNELIRNIRTQTEETSPEVWQQVREHYADAAKAFEDSVPSNLR